KNDASLRRHHPEAIAVAVERDSDFRALLFHPGNQVFEVLGMGRIGMVVGKAPVDLAVELVYLATQAPVEVACRRASDAVAAVDRNPHRARKTHVRDDAVQIRLADVHAAVAARAPDELARLDPPAAAPGRLARRRG